MNRKLFTFLAIAAAATAPAFAESMDDHGNGSESSKPMGFRFFDNHLTIKPYVSLSYSYDSNIDTSHKSEGDNIFCVEPAADFTWRGDRWELAGSIFYRYNAYCDYSDEMDEKSYGERLAYKWSNVGENGKGWNLLLSERYQYISQSDSLNDGSGRGIWRDRENIMANGVLERRFTDLWHASVMGQYNWIDYKNDTGKYAPLYGWSQWAAGIEAGYAASKWTDLLISGGYSDYTQKKSHGYKRYSNDSEVWTLQGGFGTHATEKITYRALAGASWLDYGGAANECGWTYQLSANWRVTRQFQVSLLGNSYYQPSERSLGQAVKVSALSAGFSYLTFGDKMTLSGDISWRHEENVYNDRYLTSRNNYDEDLLSVRLGANYTFNRWVSVFANFVWEEDFCDTKAYEYDRFRGTVGLRFHY